MPTIGGILESSLYVEDVSRSRNFYQSLFLCRTLFEDHRLCSLAISDRQVLLLFKKGSSTTPLHTSGGIVPPSDGDGELHIAFAIAEEDYDDWKSVLANTGIAIESEVTWTRGGKSVYFRDPDRHLIELVTPGTWEIY